jgi:AcrR family transcriptional regulator
MKKTATPLPPGRPRAFDADVALEKALQVFWKKGYEGASLTDLTEAMGINRPSLYAAFGNKEALFRKAMDRYTSGPGCHIAEALKAKTARAVAERVLAGTVDMLTCPNTPQGCLLVQAALACGDEAEPVRRALIEKRTSGEKAIRERLERAVAEGDLPRGTNAADLARYLCTVTVGLSVQAASGAKRAELQRVAETAMRAWPAGR